MTVLTNIRFLWVHLQLEELTHAATENEMIAMIDYLPTDLQPLYRRLKQNVDQQTISRRLLAYAILEFLTFTDQPMTLDSVVRGISGRLKPAGLYAEDLNLALILSVCHGLAVYDEGPNILCLIHTTARDYLARRFDAHLCHAWIAEACLRGLLHFANSSPSESDWTNLRASKSGDETTVSLTLYAAMTWHYHSRKCLRTPEYGAVERHFLGHKTAPRVWIWILEVSNGVHAARLRTLSGFLRALVDPYTTESIYLAACFFGLDDLFTDILMKGEMAIRDDIVIPAFPDVRRCIPWISQCNDIEKLELTTNLCTGLSEKVVEKGAEIQECSGRRWETPKEYFDLSIRASDLRDTLLLARLMGDIRCAGAICAAEQGHRSIFARIYDDLLRRNPMSDSQFRYFVDTCRSLACTGGHIGVLQVMGSPERYLPQYGVSPFGCARGSLLGLSASVGNRDMLLFCKQDLELVDGLVPAKDLTLAAIRNDQ